MMNSDTREIVNKRLSRIAGQVAGLQRMVENERYCIEVIDQISAVRAALAKVSGIMLASHMQTCIKDAFTSGDKMQQDKKIDELVATMNRASG